MLMYAMEISKSIILQLDTKFCKDSEDTGSKPSFRESLVFQTTQFSHVSLLLKSIKPEAGK